MMFELASKKVLVTGASSGIGRAIAQLFAKQGAMVWVADIDAKAGAATVKLIEDAGGEASFVAVDVRDDASASAARETVGELDVLVNNAGIGHVGDLLGTSAADLDRLHAVNVRGPFNLARAFVPGMLERRAGSVINLASIGGVLAVRDRLAYTVSKHAVVGMTRALALDHSHTGVRFNAICPGRVDTPFVRARLAEYPDPEAALREMSSTQLNGRMVRVDEVAAAALYLASDASAMITGSTLLIDGGWSVGK
jgi:NAD(P)-dependent dehydrogenase (short-subunit alcohol dehydrogenase family)